MAGSAKRRGYAGTRNPARIVRPNRTAELDVGRATPFEHADPGVPSRRVRVSAVVLCTAVMASLAFTSPLTAQEVGNLIGRVIDAQQGRPLPGVQVSVLGSGSSTVTDESGTFRLPDLPPGPALLQVGLLGYGTHMESVIIEAGGELSIQVRLSPQAIELAPLVVESRSELEERRRSSGHGINEIDANEIDRAARAGLDLTELLQVSMPGALASPDGLSRTCV